MSSGFRFSSKNLNQFRPSFSLSKLSFVSAQTCISVSIGLSLSSSIGLAKGTEFQAIGNLKVYTANESGSLSQITFPEGQVKTISAEGPIHNVQVSPNGELMAATLLPVGDKSHNHADTKSKTSEPKSASKNENKSNGFVVFYSTISGTQIKKVEVGQGPAHVDFTSDGKYALVTNTKSNNVSVVDMSNFEVTHTVSTGRSPHGFRIGKNIQTAYVANMADKSISIIDMNAKKETNRIKVAGVPITTAISADGKYLFASLNDRNELIRIELPGKKITKVAVGKGPAQIFLAPDEKTIFVANQGKKNSPSATVSKIDVQTMAVLATIDVGKGAHGLAVSKDGRFTFVTNLFENTMSVIENSKDKEILKLDVGGMPNGISLLE